MKKKIQKKYTYQGLGFPVELNDVSFILLENEWIPVIDVRKVSQKAFKDLALQENRLSGNQIKFVRDHLGMSLREFADKVVHQSHMAVSKWEKFYDAATNMDQATELVLRLYIFHETISKNSKSEQSFINAYEKISSMRLI